MQTVAPSIGGYFDDSGTHAGSPVMTMGGVLGTVAQWDVFAPAWAALLKSPLPGRPPLRQFHLAPCRAGAGEFSGYSPGERDHLTYLFRQIIFDSGLVTIAAALDNAAWDELVVGDVAEQLGNPLQFLLYQCMNAVSDTVRMRRPGEQVYMFFDAGIRDRVRELAKSYMRDNINRGTFSGVGWAPVAECVAMQAADMMATETFQYGQEWLFNRVNPIVNPHFEHFRFRDLSCGLVFDRASLEEMVERVKKGPPTA
jgi:hypothetical protein